MKKIIIILLLILPHPVKQNQNRLTDLEREIISDNESYLDWSYSLQEEVKRVYQHSYRR